MKAADAERIGLVNKCVPANQLDEAVSQYASYYATAPTRAIGLIKKMLNKSETSSLEDMLEYEAYCQEIAGKSDDYKEGVEAFLGKRKADFKGR